MQIRILEQFPKDVHFSNSLHGKRETFSMCVFFLIFLWSCSQSSIEKIKQGMSQYGESQEFSEAESFVDHNGSVSFPFSAAQSAEHSPSQDRAQESNTNSTNNFRVERCEFYQLSP